MTCNVLTCLLYGYQNVRLLSKSPVECVLPAEPIKNEIGQSASWMKHVIRITLISSLLQLMNLTCCRADVSIRRVCNDLSVLCETITDIAVNDGLIYDTLPAVNTVNTLCDRIIMRLYILKNTSRQTIFGKLCRLVMSVLIALTIVVRNICVSMH